MRHNALLIIAIGQIAACSEARLPDSGTSLFMDVHNLGPGNVTAEAVAKAHAADLAVEDRHGVRFIRYWVDEANGRVYCLSNAPSAEAIVETHREAHGLLPDSVGVVTAGE